MNFKKISYSSLNTFLLCQKKFIIDKKIKNKKVDLHSNSLPLAFGSYFHFIMEIYFKLFSKKYSIKDLLSNSFKSDTYVEQFKTKINISESDLGLIKVSLQKDRSKKNIKKHLKFLAEAHFVNFTISDKTSVLKYLEECIEMLHNMVDDHRRKWFDIKPEQVIGVEYYFDKITNSGAPIHGYIDLILDIDGYYFIDWKSGQIHITKNEIIESLQLDFYNCGTIDKFTDKPRYFCIDMCRLGYSVSIIKYATDAERVDVFLGSVWDKWLAMEEIKVKGSICELCSYCDIKHTCDAVKNAEKIGVLTPSQLSDMTTEALGKWFLDFKNREKVFGKMKKEVQEIIEERITKNEEVGNIINADSLTIELKHYESIKLEPDEIKCYISIKKAIEEDIITVSITKLKEKIGESKVEELKKISKNISVTTRLFVKRKKKVG